MNKIFSIALRSRFSSTRYNILSDLSSSTGDTFKANQLESITRNQLLPIPPFTAEDMPFGHHSTDHMVIIDWGNHTDDPKAKPKWNIPKLQPYADLQLNPFNSTLHYAVQCYEGLKAYKNQKGEIRIFRPECNAIRFKKTSIRLTLPDFDGNELIKVIEALVMREQRWIPPFSQFSLYIRPFHISAQNSLGVKPPSKTKLIIVTGPVGPYYPSGFKPISLLCSSDHIRSAPKGTGFYKIGGNYGPTIMPSLEAQSRGHHQVLWLWQNKILEVGSSNIFFIFKDSKGQIQIATPQLQDLVLPGVTRDSILVTERLITIEEVISRQQKGQLLECFGAGTAVIVSPIKCLEYKGVKYDIPVDPKIGAGPITKRIRQQMLDIQQGRAQDKFGWIRRLK